jgi:hypothetical protein
MVLASGIEGVLEFVRIMPSLAFDHRNVPERFSEYIIYLLLFLYLIIVINE